MANNLVLPGRSCLSCKFYQRPTAIGEMGECHRHPPNFQMIPVAGPNGELTFQNVVGFTQVSETMWCGEHKPKIDG